MNRAQWIEYLKQKYERRDKLVHYGEAVLIVNITIHTLQYHTEFHFKLSNGEEIILNKL